MKEKEMESMKTILREIMGKSNKNVSDIDVQNALEQLGLLKQSGTLSDYCYQHPDYAKLVSDMPESLQPLLDTSEDHEDPHKLDAIIDSCSQMSQSTLATTVNSLIYFWLDRWHNSTEDEGVWLYPIHMAIILAERFQLNQCLSAILEIERQDCNFTEAFFDDFDLVGMVPACIYRIVTVDDLPLLASFVGERGIHSFNKAEVIAAVSTLPRRSPQLLPQIQQWLCDLLSIFADDIDPAVGDVLLLESIVHCCIHTRCLAAKPMIIRMYNKYKMPNILIPGGVNEVRKTIKRAYIGILKEEMDSAEDIYNNAITTDEYDDDDEYDEFDEYDEYDDDDDYENEDYDEEVDDDADKDLKTHQRYCGYAYGGKAVYLPVHRLKKFTLHIELKNSEPVVWREIQVPSSISLTSLAQAILLAMGWDEDHLHQFLNGRRDHYATSLNELSQSLHYGTKDGSRYGISHLLQKKDDITVFEYDYGDSWYHSVKLTEVAEYVDGEAKAIVLVGGANACPPDDCGGIHRYRYLLELMKERPRSRELYDFYEWMGCKWDPTFFPMKETAESLNEMNP